MDDLPVDSHTVLQAILEQIQAREALLSLPPEVAHQILAHVYDRLATDWRHLIPPIPSKITQNVVQEPALNTNNDADIYADTTLHLSDRDRPPRQFIELVGPMSFQMVEAKYVMDLIPGRVLFALGLTVLTRPATRVARWLRWMAQDPDYGVRIVRQYSSGRPYLFSKAAK